VSFRQPPVGTICRVPSVVLGATSCVVAKNEAPPDLMLAVGKRLKAARLAVGDLLKVEMTQDMMAHVIGVTRAALSFWERGERLAAVPAMLRLEERFGIPVDWIYTGRLRIVPYDVAAALERCAAEVGAPIGGPVAEFPMETAPERGRPAARTPRRQGPKWLHEDPAGRD
jgi:DNA-binding XRE family transcriptional regulator